MCIDKDIRERFQDIDAGRQDEAGTLVTWTIQILLSALASGSPLLTARVSDLLHHPHFITLVDESALCGGMVRDTLIDDLSNPNQLVEAAPSILVTLQAILLVARYTTSDTAVSTLRLLNFFDNNEICQRFRALLQSAVNQHPQALGPATTMLQALAPLDTQVFAMAEESKSISGVIRRLTLVEGTDEHCRFMARTEFCGTTRIRFCRPSDLPDVHRLILNEMFNAHMARLSMQGLT
jgi:hypothetical protein